MKRISKTVLLGLAMSIMGCQGGLGVQLLERENAQLCEQIVLLEVQLAEQQLLLQQYEDQLPASPGDQTSYSRSPSTASQPTLAPPTIQRGTPSPDGDFLAPPGGSTIPDEGSAGDYRDDASRAPLRLNAPESAPVTHVTLDSAGTSGYDEDGKPGDEGIRIAVQPRDSARRLTPADGDLTVAAWDAELLELMGEHPELRDEARVGLWKLSADEVAEAQTPTENGPTLQLRLPWPQAPPQASRLHLFVRYRTAAGEELQAEAPLLVHLADSPREPAVLTSRTAHAPKARSRWRSDPSDMRRVSGTGAKSSKRRRPQWRPNR